MASDDQRLIDSINNLTSEIRKELGSSKTFKESVDSLVKTIYENQKAQRGDNASFKRIVDGLLKNNESLEKALKQNTEATKKSTDVEEKNSRLEKKRETQTVKVEGLDVGLFSKLPKILKDLKPPTNINQPTQTESNGGGGFLSGLMGGLLGIGGIGLLGILGGAGGLLSGIATMATSFNMDGPWKGTVMGIGKQIFQKSGSFLRRLSPIFRRVPIVGSLFQIYDAYTRFKKGDIVGGGISILSSIANLFPGVGTAVSLGLDVLNAVLDHKAGGSSEQANSKKLNILGKWGNKIKKEWLSGKWDDTIVIGPLAKAWRAWDNNDMGEFIKNMALAMPPFELLYAIINPEGTTKQTRAMNKALSNWGNDLGEWVYTTARRKNSSIRNLARLAEAINSGDWIAVLQHMSKLTPQAIVFDSLTSLLGDGQEEAINSEIKARKIDPKSDVGKKLFDLIKEQKILEKEINNSASETERTSLEGEYKLNFHDRKKLLAEAAKKDSSIIQDTDVRTEPTDKQIKGEAIKAGIGLMLRSLIPGMSFIRDGFIQNSDQKGMKIMSGDFSKMVQLDPRDGVFAGPFTGIANQQNLQILEKIANNTAASNQNLGNLIRGFNDMALALQNTLGDKAKIAAVPIANSSDGPDNYQIAQAGNSDIRDLRKSMEFARHRVPGSHFHVTA